VRAVKSRVTLAVVLVLWTVTLALAVVAVVVKSIGQTTVGPPGLEYLLFLPEVLAFSTAGALVARRRPRMAAGWLLLAVGLAWTMVGALDGYVRHFLVADWGSLPWGAVAAWVLNWVWVPAFIALGLFFLLFPDGRLPGRRWGVVLWANVGGFALVLVGRAFMPGPMAEVPAIANPFGIPGAGGILRVAEAVGNPLGGVAGIASMVSLCVRYRRSDGVQRRQLLWMALAGIVFVAVMLVGNVLDLIGITGVDVGNLYIASFAAVPIAAAVAILKYRLFDIDLVIGKAIVLGGLLGFITAVYLGVVVGVGALVGRGTGSNVVLAVVATALAAVGVQPLRARLQGFALHLVFPPVCDAEPVADVTIRSLGAFCVVLGGQPVPIAAWQSKKARTLVKILVARRGRATTREQLMEVLWPDEAAEVVTRRLSVALATARAVLDPDRRHPSDQFIVADKDTIRLDLGNLQVDIERFLVLATSGLTLHRKGRLAEASTALRAAEATYAGDFLEEDRYEDWAIALREEAMAAYQSAVMTLAQIAASSGDAAAAIRYYLRILERDGYNEPAHLGLVATLERDGRRGEARRQYRMYAERMAQIRVPVAPFPRPGQALNLPGLPL
jgi:DNA-binding SARP family transcriptional activator